jgi:hypothetical protein
LTASWKNFSGLGDRGKNGAGLKINEVRTGFFLDQEYRAGWINLE